MILVHSLECDEGWVTYGGHDYMMNFSTRSDGTSYTYMVDLTESKIRAKCI